MGTVQKLQQIISIKKQRSTIYKIKKSWKQPAAEQQRNQEQDSTSHHLALAKERNGHSIGILIANHDLQQDINHKATRSWNHSSINIQRNRESSLFLPIGKTAYGSVGHNHRSASNQGNHNHTNKGDTLDQCIPFVILSLRPSIICLKQANYHNSPDAFMNVLRNGAPHVFEYFLIEPKSQ